MLSMLGVETEMFPRLLGLKYNKLFRRDKSMSRDFQSSIRRAIGEP